MARDVSRAQKALAVGRWQRFVRSVKRIMTAVSLVAMAGLLGFATKLATDMPVEAIAITGEMRHVDRRDLESVIAPQVENGFLLTDLAAIRGKSSYCPGCMTPMCEESGRARSSSRDRTAANCSLGRRRLHQSARFHFRR